ncbi:MAG: hypothetical protein K0Q55_2499 [Verrucomicrobia bacterium]|jgi:hypothetical protein|nr:hypothetical protein [Verrucomicrobiota bacterium]
MRNVKIRGIKRDEPLAQGRAEGKKSGLMEGLNITRFGFAYAVESVE